MKPGRNDPCPCGSGLKFKKCCQLKVTSSTTNQTGQMKAAAPSPREMNQLITLLNSGRHAELEQQLTVYLDNYPNNGFFWKVLGVSLQLQHKDGLVALQKAADLLPLEADAHCNLGNALRALKRYDEAVISYQRAIALKPDLAEAYNNLGNAQFELDQRQAAEANYRQAIRIFPDYDQAHNNLGFLLQLDHRLDEALASCQKALAISPNFAEAHNNTGIALYRLDRFEEAINSFQRGLELKPNFADCHVGIAGCLLGLGRPEEAIIECKRAIELNPAIQGAYVNYGLALEALGCFDEARSVLNKALTLEGNTHNVHYALGYIDFYLGNLTAAWAGYDYRFSTSKRRECHAPVWTGDNLTGKTLLIWKEQGVGDEIFFASLYAKAIAQAQHVVIEGRTKLQPLLARSFPNAQVVAATDPPQPATVFGIDYQCAAGSLGRWLCNSVQEFPRLRQYLLPDPARINYWKTRLADLGSGLKIGICWRSSMNKGSRAQQYSTLDQWHALFSVPGVHFINLQYDECTAELAQARQQHAIPIHAFTEVNMFDDLDETSALISALDLVVGAATAVTALSAAVGIPTCQMSFGQIWTTLGTQHDAFAANLHYYQRKPEQDWSEIIAKIAAQIQQRGIPLPNQPVI